MISALFHASIKWHVLVFLGWKVIASCVYAIIKKEFVRKARDKVMGIAWEEIKSKFEGKKSIVQTFIQHAR